METSKLYLGTYDLDGNIKVIHLRQSTLDLTTFINYLLLHNKLSQI